MRFYHSCFQVDALERGDKRLICQVMRRVRALQKRRPKHDVIWDQPGVHPRGV
jgi:hypothetical protein